MKRAKSNLRLLANKIISYGCKKAKDSVIIHDGRNELNFVLHFEMLQLKLNYKLPLFGRMERKL